MSLEFPLFTTKKVFLKLDRQYSINDHFQEPLANRNDCYPLVNTLTNFVEAT